MRRSILWALTMAAGLAVAAAASAQTTVPQVVTPSVDPGSAPQSASPYGATYVPGVGFRYLAPGSARVYAYRAYGPRVYGYRRGHRDERCFWFWDDCWRRR